MDSKRITILATVILVAALFWVVASGWMQSADRFEHWGKILVTGGLLTLTASVMAMGFLLLRRGYATSYLIGGILLGFFVVFGVHWLYLIGAAIAVSYWWVSAHRIGRELIERRSMRVGSIIVHGLPKILLGLYILLSFAFYLTPASQNITQKEATQAFREQLDSASDIVLQSELDKLPPSQREQVKREISNRAVLAFINVLNFQICVSNGVCMPSVLDLLPPLYAFFFFLTLFSVGFVFRELGELVAVGLFRGLKYAKIVSISQEDAKVDVLKI